jgi:ribosomal protein S12 methylthiotransferase
MSMEENLELVHGLREKLPHGVLRSTFLVGFPGEGEAEFEELLKFQEEARFDWLGVFAFSPEEDTAAEILHRKRALRVPKRTAAARKKMIEEKQGPITEERMNRFIGSRLEVFVEELVEGEELSLGRAYFHAPEVDGLVVLQGNSVPPGRICTAKVIRRHGLDLEAVIL